MNTNQDTQKSASAGNPAGAVSSDDWRSALLEQTLAGIYVIQDGHFRYVNQEFANIFGYASPAEIIDTFEITELIAPEDRATVVENVRKRTEGEAREIRYSFVGLRRDGRRIDVEVHGHAMLFNGRPAVIGLILDITERKLTEEAIRRLNQELERRVQDRTAELEAANQELEAFAYSVSHDLRAPLRHISGFVELLRKRLVSTLDPESVHYLGTISKSAEHMATLIDDLLSFSRLGRSTMTKAQFDLGDLIGEVIREFEPETQGRNVDWQIAELPKITGDRAMLRVAVTNLVSNALKFTRPRAHAVIEIGCLSPTAAETIVFIRDNGVGFDMQYVDKLFGVFQRLHGAEEFEGTGIGLANVRRVISRHGGRTWAEGKVDGGATFYFALPRTIGGC